MNFGEVRSTQVAKSTLLASMLVPLGSFEVCSDALERVGCGKQREANAPFIPSKLATLVTEFTAEDLPLDTTATLVPRVAVRDLPLGRTLS